MAHEDLYLSNIVQSINKIDRYTDGFDEKGFQADEKTQDAVIRQLEIIGEAARLLPDELKTANPHVPWRDISGMRNHLIHRYFRVDIDEVWRTAKSDLDTLREAVEKIMETLT